MKNLLVLTLLFISHLSLGATLTCLFTEPFLTAKVTLADGKMNVNNDAMEPESARIIDLDFKTTVKSDGILEMIFTEKKSGTQVLKATFDGQGSDGASDEILPISGVLTMPSPELDPIYAYPPLHGGCHF